MSAEEQSGGGEEHVGGVASVADGLCGRPRASAVLREGLTHAGPEHAEDRLVGQLDDIRLVVGVMVGLSRALVDDRRVAPGLALVLRSDHCGHVDAVGLPAIDHEGEGAVGELVNGIGDRCGDAS